jgi:hypothetical protein
MVLGIKKDLLSKSAFQSYASSFVLLYFAFKSLLCSVFSIEKPESNCIGNHKNEKAVVGPAVV